MINFKQENRDNLLKKKKKNRKRLKVNQILIQIVNDSMIVSSHIVQSMRKKSVLQNT